MSVPEHNAMKFVSFDPHLSTGPGHRVGLLIDGEIIDIATTYRDLLDSEDHPTPQQACQVTTPTDMRQFIAQNELAIDATKKCVSFVNREEEYVANTQYGYDMSEVTLLSPLLRPNSIRDCTVYEGHLLNTRDIETGELPKAYYEKPLYYKGNPDAIVHPNETVEWPAFTDKLDFELEIAAIIGKQGRDISSEDAEEYIFGYTLFNDFSARDVQSENKPLKMGPGKSKDFANGFGPSLVTTNSIEITNCRTEVRVNDKVWSEGTSGGMTHSWGEILAYLSDGVELKPGDVIGSGTVVGGCGLELDQWLESGDELALTVEGIGTLRHSIA